MAWTAEFEEKEFEIPLYVELLNSAPVWSPGQVLESWLGFDAALGVTHSAFWQRIGFHVPLRGIAPRTLRRIRPWRRIGRLLPDFRGNLFLQVKRPEGLVRRSVDLRAKGLGSPYWRFRTRSHQQKALERLDRSVRNRALVAYACPAFGTLRELYDFTRGRQLVENSTFVRARRLSGHSTWLYDRAGTAGFGCSEPEFIEEPPLLYQLDEIGSVSNDMPSAAEGLAELASAIVETCAGLAASDQSEQSREFLARARVISEFVVPDEARHIHDFLLVSTFASLFGLEWLVVGK